jgi:hypothetical protein
MYSYSVGGLHLKTMKVERICSSATMVSPIRKMVVEYFSKIFVATYQTTMHNLENYIMN